MRRAPQGASPAPRNSTLHFPLSFLLVGIAQVLDVHVLNQPGVLRTAVIFWAIANNGLSILENAAHLGLPVPEQLKQVLEKLHDRKAKSGDPEAVEGDPIEDRNEK